MSFINNVQMSPKSTFDSFRSIMGSIKDEPSHELAFKQVKEAVKALTGPTEVEKFYSVKYKKSLPADFNPTLFWEIMDDKARKPQKYLPIVKACVVKDERSLETVTCFVRILDGAIPETFWISETSKRMLIFLEHNETLLTGSNELKQGKDGQYYYIGRYIALNSPLDSPSAFTTYMNSVFEKMVEAKDK